MAILSNRGITSLAEDTRTDFYITKKQLYYHDKGKTIETKKTTRGVRASKHIGLVRNDSYLEPYEPAIRGRHDHAVWKLSSLTNNGKKPLTDFANGHKYYGLHKLTRGWVFREWVPNATDIFLVGDFNNWQETDRYRAKRIDDNGTWELKLSDKAVKHGDLYKMHVYWNGGSGERIPAWCQRVVQDENTKVFSAQVWNPRVPYKWKKNKFKADRSPLLIYECHVGMSQDAEKVGTYNEFRENVLPRIIKDGYNCIQVMAIQEHPYYGSFGYHVSSFFAASSRFGTPEELKQLIDTAHQNGIAVIMDIVHSHAVRNEIEGLGNLAGDPNQYFYPENTATIPHGTVCVSTMAKTKCFISCSPTASIGLRNIISMVSGLTV